LLPCAAWGGDGPVVAVVFPDLGEPYRSVFGRIVEGVEGRFKGRVVNMPLAVAAAPGDLAQEIRRNDARVVIALGRHGVSAAASLERHLPVVAGAVVNVPEGDARGMTVLSLAPDPGLLFGRLRGFLPEARRVFAVHEPGQSGWQIRLAREAARAAGLELVAIEVTDLKAAARAYQNVLAGVDPRRDAIWLLQDPLSSDETTILPFLLEESWSRAIPLFSSNLAHVRRGALFALYPDNLELGRRLGATAQALAAGGPGAPVGGVLPLREVMLAVNQRTAQHLGLHINPREQGVDLVLPAQ
ncbi:MAG: ABC transporter substrate binding protein, partial [Rhodocyclaceae bacterium]|nr:ABC transporter substrate binding protein [Rhodocyclaceae bacterium]